MFAFLARFIYMYNTVCKHMNVLGFGHTACFECLDFLRNMYMNMYVVHILTGAGRRIFARGHNEKRIIIPRGL